MRQKRRRLFLFLQCGLLSQTLPTMTSTTLTFLNVAHMRLQSMKTERPWTLPRPRFVWFELMLEDKSQSRYWKKHFRMRKDTFLRLVNLVSPEIKGSPRILQTANDGRKGQLFHSPKAKTANFWCVLFTSFQSAFLFHLGINRARHKRSAKKGAKSLAKGMLRASIKRGLRHRLKIVLLKELFQVRY